MFEEVADDRLIRFPEVQRLTGLRRTQLYALVKRGQFPEPVKLSERCSAWSERKVRHWIHDRLTRKASA